MMDAIKEIINNATLAFINNDVKLAAKVEPLEQVIDRIRDKLKEAHVKRLTNGECTIELGFIFSDLITSMERVSDHCSNIAVGVIEINNNGYDAHEYLHELKNSDDIQYNADYKEYKKNMHFRSCFEKIIYLTHSKFQLWVFYYADDKMRILCYYILL